MKDQRYDMILDMVSHLCYGQLLDPMMTTYFSGRIMWNVTMYNKSMSGSRICLTYVASLV